MINFTVLTDTPARLRNFLISRGVIKEATGSDGQTVYVGTLPGMEWVEVPNPIVTDPGSGTPVEPGYVPPTYDTRRVFLVKFAHKSAANEIDGETSTIDPETGRQVATNQYDWSRFGKWVKNNSSVVTAPAGYTINGEPVGDAYKINGENVWLVRDNPGRFGSWQ